MLVFCILFAAMGTLPIICYIIIPFRQKYIEKRIAIEGEITGVYGLKSIDEVRDDMGLVFEDPIVKFTYDGKEIETRAVFKRGERDYNIGDTVKLLVSKKNLYDVQVNEIIVDRSSGAVISIFIGIVMLIASGIMTAQLFGYGASKAADNEANEAYEALSEGSNMNAYSDASAEYLQKSVQFSFSKAKFCLPQEYVRVTDNDTETSTWYENKITKDCIYIDVQDMGSDPLGWESYYEDFLTSNFTLESVEPKEIEYNNNKLKYYRMIDVVDEGETINCYGCYSVNKNTAIIVVYFYTERSNDLFIDFLSTLRF